MMVCRRGQCKWRLLNMSSKLILTLRAGLFASAAFAQSAPSTPHALARGARLQQQMQILDKDGDGAISREEASGHKNKTKQNEQNDANKDGKLAAEELQSFRANKRAKHAARFVVLFLVVVLFVFVVLFLFF